MLCTQKRNNACSLVDLGVWAVPQVLHTALELIQQFLHVHSVEKMRERCSSVEGTTDQNCNKTNHLIRQKESWIHNWVHRTHIKFLVHSGRFIEQTSIGIIRSKKSLTYICSVTLLVSEHKCKGGSPIVWMTNKGHLLIPLYPFLKKRNLGST